MIFGLINSNPKIIDSMPFHQSYTTKIYGFLKWVCSTDDCKRSTTKGSIPSYIVFSAGSFSFVWFALDLQLSDTAGTRMAVCCKLRWLSLFSFKFFNCNHCRINSFVIAFYDFIYLACQPKGTKLTNVCI